jgi:hypothetical protein
LNKVLILYILKELIERVFLPSDFIVEIEEHKGEVVIKTIDGKECLFLNILPNLIYIDTVQKCGVTGTNVLKKVEQLTKLMPNINEIFLLDASKMSKCSIDIDLAIIKILTKGESWYNSLGYTSATGDTNKEKSINEKIINMSYNNFMDNLVKDASIKKRGIELFPDADVNTSVKLYFNSIWMIINNANCDNVNMVIWLKDVINRIIKMGILHYNPSLKKIVMPKGGRKRTRRYKKNIRTKNTKKYKKYKKIQKI